MRLWSIAAGFAALLAAAAALAQSPAIVGEVPAAGGAMRVLYLAPAQPPRALVVLLPGGSGIIGLDPSGAIRNGGNFLVRTRVAWVAQGFAVVVPDSPAGMSLIGLRHRADYAEAMARAIDFGRARAGANLPVWLVGTSNGSTAAMNGAAHLGTRVAGVVLTSSVTAPGRSNESVFDGDPGAVAVPALVVANVHDSCQASPPGNAPNILAALSRSPKKELITFDSTALRSDPCEAFSPHGYLGIENQVVRRIADWIKAGG